MRSYLEKIAFFFLFFFFFFYDFKICLACMQISVIKYLSVIKYSTMNNDVN